jgi:FecR protein
MSFHRIDLLLRTMLLLGVLITSCGSVWAVPSICKYTKSGTGIGGTGMGGTGTVARGTGIGGTGIRPEIEMAEMHLAGKVIFSKGIVKAQSNGRSRMLAKGDPVCTGEIIMTSQLGTVQIKMVDDGLIAVRPQTQLKIEKFVYAGTNKDSSLLALLNGSFRAVTGKIGKEYPANDLIKTPAAVIGVRGTDHEATVILPGAKGSYPAGTYDKVNFGITFIKTNKGEIDIHPNQVGFSANIGELPTLLKATPGFYNTTSSRNELGSHSKDGIRDGGGGKHEKMEKPLGQSGGGAKFDEPVEAKTPHSEHPDIQNGMERPERPAIPDVPERPEVPDVPERPAIPSVPEIPAIPSVPEPPSSPE